MINSFALISGVSSGNPFEYLEFKTSNFSLFVLNVHIIGKRVKIYQHGDPFR